MEAYIFSIAKVVFTLYVVMVVIAIAMSLINSLFQLLKKMIIKMREVYNKIIVALTFSAAKDGNDRKDDSPSSLSSSALDMNMRESVAAMEDLLCYRFKNKTLLQEALTHSSYADSSPSYQRLEFLGGSALHFALAEYVFGAYPGLGPAQLSALREANIRTEKLARVAVRHKLHRYVRHKDPSLDAKVGEFVQAVKDEDGAITNSGLIEAPKILADIVESIAASVYLDCNHDLKALREVFKRLMEPIVNLGTLQEHTQPTTIRSEPMKLKMREGNEMDSPSSLSSMAVAMATVDMKMREELAPVERLLRYRFRDKTLLQEALTHSSYIDSPSYQRLEFVGDAVLGLAVAEYVFRSHRELVPGKLSLLREANVRTENLARVAVRRELYRYVRYKDNSLDHNVKKFVLAVQDEDQDEDRSVNNCGSIKAPKILADIVESIAAAVYIDCNYNLKATWQVFKSFMEPIVTLETLHKHSKPTTMLNELCQKQGKKVDYKYSEITKLSIPKFSAFVFVDDKPIGSGSWEQTKKNARFNAAKEALQKLLWEFDHLETETEDGHGSDEIKWAKGKLNELCQKERWGLPVYRIVREIGPPHERRFMCSAEVDTNDDTYTMETGEIKSRAKDAERSAAFKLLQMLQD